MTTEEAIRWLDDADEDFEMDQRAAKAWQHIKAEMSRLVASWPSFDAERHPKAMQEMHDNGTVYRWAGGWWVVGGAMSGPFPSKAEAVYAAASLA